ncbi:hypothetical protein Tco_0121829 [Tanacetum coccineum]
MFYCVVPEEHSILLTSIVQKKSNVQRDNPNRKSSIWHVLDSSLSTHLEAYPHLDNGIYDNVDRVMRPLAP